VNVFHAYSKRPSVHIFCSISWYVPLQTRRVALQAPLSYLAPAHSHAPLPSFLPASSTSAVRSSDPSAATQTYSAVPPTAATVSWSASRVPTGQAPRTWPCSHTTHSVTADTSRHTSASPFLRCHSQTQPGPFWAQPYPVTVSRLDTFTPRLSPRSFLPSDPRRRSCYRKAWMRIAADWSAACWSEAGSRCG